MVTNSNFISYAGIELYKDIVSNYIIIQPSDKSKVAIGFAKGDIKHIIYPDGSIKKYEDVKIKTDFKCTEGLRKVVRTLGGVTFAGVIGDSILKVEDQPQCIWLYPRKDDSIVIMIPIEDVLQVLSDEDF